MLSLDSIGCRPGSPIAPRLAGFACPEAQIETVDPAGILSGGLARGAVPARDPVAQNPDGALRGSLPA
ncbi:hypothetical protein SBA6_440030 [Candidatus Sulfopaludibacter sp. SbA6]|nr:hypothetical protein SBA6_440030 [Candidatus Sulfopaludibacter sp. SbA6]